MSGLAAVVHVTTIDDTRTEGDGAVARQDGLWYRTVYGRAGEGEVVVETFAIPDAWLAASNAPAADASGTFIIVRKGKDGMFYPFSRPAVHPTEDAAAEEARRLVEITSGVSGMDCAGIYVFRAVKRAVRGQAPVVVEDV